MKKFLLSLVIISSFFAAKAQTYVMMPNGYKQDSAAFFTPVYTAIAGKQNAGAYLLANQTITVSGDLTGSGTNSITAILATVNSNVGSFGTASATPTITLNAKGLATSAVNTPILITESQVTSLVTDLSGKQATITLTTTGSGAATFVGNVLNVPTPAAGSNVQNNDESTGAATATLTLLHTAIVGTYNLWKNGMKLPVAKWALSGTTITLTDARVAGDVFSSSYNW